MKELPSEVWGMVLGNLEEIRDFFQLQLVCRTFHALVKDNCWTKVKRIEIGSRMDQQWVWVFLETVVPSQCFRLPIAEAAEVLEQLVQKATNTTAVELTFYKSPVDIFQRFLEVLASTSKIKIQEFKMEHLTALHPMDTQVALAQFLDAKKESLTSLTVRFCFERWELGPIPPKVLQAFRDCSALERVEMFCSSERVVESILHEKSQLQAVQFDAVLGSVSARAFAKLLLELRVKLLQFNCREFILLAYAKEVVRWKRTQDHPLRSLTKLEIQWLNSSPPFPWALFPSLEQLIIYDGMEVSIDAFVELVQDFLMQWADDDVERVLQWQICVWNNVNGYGIVTYGGMVGLAEVARLVQAAYGCHVDVSLTHPGTDPKHILHIRKGNATLTISIGCPFLR